MALENFLTKSNKWFKITIGTIGLKLINVSFGYSGDAIESMKRLHAVRIEEWTKLLIPIRLSSSSVDETELTETQIEGIEVVIAVGIPIIVIRLIFEHRNS